MQGLPSSGSTTRRGEEESLAPDVSFPHTEGPEEELGLALEMQSLAGLWMPQKHKNSSGCLLWVKDWCTGHGLVTTTALGASSEAIFWGRRPVS